MKITTSKQYSGSAAIKTDGTLWAWGQNAQGQLGQGSIAYFSSPVQIPGTTWKHVTFGWSSMLATKTDGSLWAWGMNYGGQLGQNSRTLYSSPRQVGSDTNWSTVTSGLRGTTFATKTAFADASKVPLAKDFEGDTTTDNDQSKVPVTWNYGRARAAHYPHIGDQLDALYWNRQGDSTHLTRINESIADTKTKWPKTLADMTQAEYEAKVKELYG